MLELPGYQAAQESLAYFLHADGGVLRISGPDQEAFLQRQTSNDVRLLSKEKAVLTVLTSPTARILDALYLLKASTAEGEPAIEALTLPGRGGATLQFLKSRIFFMDKVTVEDFSAEFAQIDLLGPGTPEALARLGAARIPEIDEVLPLDFEGSTVRVLAGSGPLGLGNRLLVPAQRREAFLAELAAAGAEALSPEAHTVLRVEAGLPGAGQELVEAYTPLEAGLGAAVSGSKGCYTGQEILARQVTYDKITQQLAGLRLEQPALSGDRVMVEGKPAGQVTSAVVSPKFGPIALAVLKRPHFEPGTEAFVHSTAGEAEQRAVVTELPFTL